MGFVNLLVRMGTKKSFLKETDIDNTGVKVIILTL